MNNIRSLLILLVFCACHPYGSPKPRGFYRIELPPKQYVWYHSKCPFSFQYPAYASIENAGTQEAEPCWINIDFQSLHGKIHLSYKQIDNAAMLTRLGEDAREFAYKHTIKATDIKELAINYPQRKVYGLYYQIEGNAASSVQFFITDSVKNYLRGALYFNVRPRIDSLKPVVDFVSLDINHLIQTFKWSAYR